MADIEKFKNWGANNLTGILAIIAGLILVMLAYKIVISLLVFSLGAVLIYFGLAKLKVSQLTDFVDNISSKVKNFFKAN